MVLATAFLFALILALLLTPLGTRAAWVVGCLGQPSARKLHTNATARLGGAVVFVSALGAWLLAARLGMPASGTRGGLVLAGATIALLTGLWDDRFGMMPVVKLLAQGAA